ncbi:MAG: SRPBCC domain-containing protein [Actinoplanes sp.]
MPDVQKQIDAVTRTTGRRKQEDGELRVSTVSQVYDTDLDDLWDVVTNAERIPRWFLPISGDLREGGKYQFEGNAGGTVSRCDKPNGFDATWEFGGMVSWIEVRLTPEGPDRTRFTLEHYGNVPDEMWDQFGPAATGMGWDSGLLGLGLYLSDTESGLTPETAAAWVGTDEGKLFMRLSSEAWAEAAIADGTDPAAARERSERCYGAYTGA